MSLLGPTVDSLFGNFMEHDAYNFYFFSFPTESMLVHIEESKQVFNNLCYCDSLSCPIDAQTGQGDHEN